MTSQISIIIPVYNEATMVSKALYHLVKSSEPQHISEILIVDGGSEDNTQETVNVLAQSLKEPPIQLLKSPKGRAKQMNFGASQATGDILYFLHIDSYPPHRFDIEILHAVTRGQLAGCFRMQFDSSHRWLRLAGWFTKFNWRACRGGDQSLFVTKPLFRSIGGYNEDYTIYEDNIFIRELYKRKQFVVLQKKIKTSARRYRQHGVWKLQVHFWVIYLKQGLGATPKSLSDYYRKHLTPKEKDS